MNLPIIHHNTIKRAEAQIGPAFEESAKASCIKAIAEERNLTLAAQRYLHFRIYAIFIVHNCMEYFIQ